MGQEKITRQLTAIAKRQGEVVEGVACAGTEVESLTFKVGVKTFLFIGPGSIRLKLGPSLSEAEQLAKMDSARYRVGAQGWVKIAISDGDPPPLDLLQRWIAESYGLFAKRIKKR